MDYSLQLEIEPIIHEQECEDNTIAEEPDNWLQAENPLLANMAEVQLKPAETKNSIIRVDHLKFFKDEQGFFLHHDGEKIILKTDDLIEYESLKIRVTIHSQQKERLDDSLMAGLDSADYSFLLQDAFQDPQSLLPSTPNVSSHGERPFDDIERLFSESQHRALNHEAALIGWGGADGHE